MTWGNSQSVVNGIATNNAANGPWDHQMETFSALLAICEEIHRWIPLTKAIGEGLWCCWVYLHPKNRVAGDLRRYLAHYDVTVMAANTKERFKVTPINILWSGDVFMGEGTM